MASQPKPAPRPEPPKPPPGPGKPGQPPAPASQPHDPDHPDHPANKPPSQPPNQPHPGDRRSQHGERELTDDDTGMIHDERFDEDNPDNARARDRRTGEIPGTPYTAPEGHDERQPGPGEPGGPGKPSQGPAPATRTIADEQRERSDRMAAGGVEQHKAEGDERAPGDRAANTRQVPGVSPSAGVTPGEPGAIRRS